jgi:uncharacterized protein (TIGR03382 family)
MRFARLCPLLPLVFVAACGEEINMSDDIDLTWDFKLTPFDTFDADMHTPYVRGTSVGIDVTSSDSDRSFTGWTLETSDEGVFRFDHDPLQDPDGTNLSDAYQSGTAVGEGTAMLTVRDEHGDVVGGTEIEVYVPDRVVLEAHGYLIQGRDDEAEIDDVRMLADGAATYLVRYFRGDRELHGNGVLSAITPADLVAEPRTSFLFENREWLTLHSSVPGAFTVDLAADGVPLGTRAVEVVPEADIAFVRVETPSERGHDDGDPLVLLAQAYDAQERRIFGIDYNWTVDGLAQTGLGDLYRYDFKKDSPQQVTASRGGKSDTVTIHSDYGYVDSSNNVGCQAGGGGGAGTAFGVLAFAALGRRRRRG